MANESRKRYLYIDVIRIFSLFLIVVFHYMQEAELAGNYYFTYRGIPYYTANLHIATVGVAMFFMISGAGLMLGNQEDFSVRRFYEKRFFRIMIPFYLTYLAVFAALWINGQGFPFDGMDISPWRFVFTLAGVDEFLIGHGISTFSLGIGEWFLGCLILMYLIFPLVRLCVLRRPALTFAAVTLGYVLLSLNYPFEFPMHTSFLIKFYDFFLGMYLVLYSRFFKKSVLFVTVPVILLALFLPSELPVLPSFTNNIVSAALFLTIMQAEDLLQKVVRPDGLLSFLCSISYEIFLVHHVIIYFFDNLYAGRELLLWQALLAFLAELVLICLAAVLLKSAESIVYRLISRLKIAKV